MDSDTAISDMATTDGAAVLLKSYVSGERGRALRVQLVAPASRVL